MKLIGLLLMTLGACATAGEKYEFDITVLSAEQTGPDDVFSFPNEESEEEMTYSIKSELSKEDPFTLEYTIFDPPMSKVFADGTGPLCSDGDSEVGVFVELLGKILNLDLKCPISEQDGTVEERVTAEIFLDEMPEDGKIFGVIAVFNEDKSLFGITFDAKVINP